MADYAKTANMGPILARIRSSPFFQSNGLAAAPTWIFESQPADHAGLPRWLDAEHGGTERWAPQQGLDAPAVDRLRSEFLEPAPER